MQAIRWAGFGIALALSACSGSSAPYSQVLTKVTSDSGQLHIEVRCDPATPTFGVAEFHFTVTNSDGTPQTGLVFAVDPYMPAMGHGASVKPTVSEIGNGVYDVKNVDFTMRGQWELRTNFQSPSTDHVVPTVDVS